jgi:hypothetical protein
MTLITLPVRALSLLALFLTLLAPTPGHTQTADPQRMSAAQALYDQAAAEMDAHKFASACPKLEEVTRLIPEGLGAKLTLGECYEGLGKLASAWSEYTRVEELAAKAGQRERARKAANVAAALRPRLATLTIEVPDEVRATPGLGITREGVPVEKAHWGTPLPVDVGEYEVVVTAPGRKRSAQSLRVAADGARFLLVVKPLEMEVSLPKAAAAPTLASSGRTRPWQRPAGLIAMGVGAAGVGAGALLGGLALSTKAQSNADGHCLANNRCDPTGLSLRERAGGFADAATGALVAGSVVLAGGLVVMLTAPTAAEKQERVGARRAGWSAAVGLTPGGLSVQGVW